MKKIKELNVTVNYNVTLTDIEVSDDVYSQLQVMCDEGEIGSWQPKSDDVGDAWNYLTDHINFDECNTCSYEVNDGTD